MGAENDEDDTVVPFITPEEIADDEALIRRMREVERVRRETVSDDGLG